MHKVACSRAVIAPQANSWILNANCDSIVVAFYLFLVILCIEAIVVFDLAWSIVASGRNTHWFLETGEDCCIYLIREAKRIGKVAAVRVIRETTDRPALIGVCIIRFC